MTKDELVEYLDASNISAPYKLNLLKLQNLLSMFPRLMQVSIGANEMFKIEGKIRKHLIGSVQAVKDYYRTIYTGSSVTKKLEMKTVSSSESDDDICHGCGGPIKALVCELGCK